MSGQLKDLPAPISANLVAEMSRTGMTGSRVAAALGVSERQITRWRGGVQPRYEFVARLGALFGRETEWFYASHSAPDRDAA